MRFGYSTCYILAKLVLPMMNEVVESIRWVHSRMEL